MCLTSAAPFSLILPSLSCFQYDGEAIRVAIMFGTIQYVPQEDTLNFQSGPFAPQHSACKTCRARKVRLSLSSQTPKMLRDLANRSCRLQLKCGGQKTGCDRCKSARIQCTYSQDNGNNRRRSNNTATARHNNQPKAVNPPTSSSDTHNSAVQYSPPSRTVDSLARTGTGSRDGNAPHEEPPFSSASNAFDPFASFLSSTDDDSTVADTCLQDLLPELNPQGMDTRLDSPGFSIQSTFSDCDSYLKNLCSLPDPLEPPFDSLGTWSRV